MKRMRSLARKHKSYIRVLLITPLIWVAMVALQKLLPASRNEHFLGLTLNFAIKWFLFIMAAAVFLDIKTGKIPRDEE